MYSRLPVLGERSAAAWPITKPATAAAPDGPLAVLSAVLTAARRHKAKFALWMLICLGTAATYAYMATPSYTATATILFEPRRQAAQAAQDPLSATGLDTSRAEGELQVLKSERLLANVFNSLDLAHHPEFQPAPPGLLSNLRGAVASAISGLLGLSPAEPPSSEVVRQIKFETFAQRVSVRRVGQSYVAEISYTANDPTLARRVANAAASAYLWQSIAAKADAAKNGAEFLQGRLNAVSAQARAASAAVAAGTLPESPTPDADARVIGAALQPLKPSAPRKPLVLALGVMIGLVGGLLGVALGQALDRRVRTPRDIALQVGLPCLAVLPKLGGRSGPRWRRSTGPALFPVPLPGSAFAKGIRELRASIQLAVVGRPNEVTIALVASTPGVGTSLIGFQLARLMRDGGHLVTLIDCDVHGSAAWAPAGRGPHDTHSLADVLHDSSQLQTLRAVDRDGIAVIPARSKNAELNKRADLGGPAFREVIERVRQTGVTILDLPPLSLAMDARVAARRADVVVLVAEAGHSTTDELIAAANGLQSVGANLIGVVLNRA